jgi:predicted AlkP superfamily phosphohydrolase/phosphomutase
MKHQNGARFRGLENQAALRTVAAACLLGLAVLTAARCAGTTSPVRQAREKVFVLGFDGLDPTLTRKWMDEGKLPNLKKLADDGAFRTLGSTQPSESPTAWSSFATGVNPGRHNIYDFLVRDPQTYAPDFNMIKREPPEFLWGTIPTKKPKVTSTRGGTSFWVEAGRAGIKSSVVTVPVTFPPESIEHGEMLAGLPAPDLRGTVGTFYVFATDISRFEEGPTQFGGILTRLRFENGTAQAALSGPPNPIVKRKLDDLKAASLTDASRSTIAKLETEQNLSLPVNVRWQRDSGAASIEVDGTTIQLKTGEWSGWVPLKFKLNFLVTIHGMIQFHLIRADGELRLYGSPINIDPRNPPIPISTPDSLAPDLVKQLGLYRTLGWADSSDKPLNEGFLDEAQFLYDSNKAMDDREQLIMKSLDRDNWELFVAAIETTDRVSHMMWRLIDETHPMYDAALAAKYGRAIEDIYKRADAFVGKLRARIPSDAVFIVMSDHGFHSFRRGVNLNTWLVENGYMTFQGQPGEAKKTLADLFGRGRFFEGVDWTNTKAYAVGLGQIYFNLRGREGKGIVSSGAEYVALQNEIRSKLLALIDPKDGKPVFRDIYRRDDIYHGEFLANGPDLQVGFNDGYRVGWQDTLGGISAAVIEDNMLKWSGDHCATATEISGGVLFINRSLGRDVTPGIMDLAPTILTLLGVPVPAGLDGKPLLR